jgi:uncharacterized protein YgiM (DUF1202 family)
MKRFRSLGWFFLFFLLTVVVTTTAMQDNLCPVLVSRALELTKSQCQNTGRNQVCYGHVMLQAQPHDGYSNFAFREMGDRVEVAALRSLRLSALDLQNQLWGVALMRVQANLPNSEPGQNAELLLYGDVQIEAPGAVFNLIPAVIQAESDVNVRTVPDESAQILADLPANQPVAVRGRSSDGLWLNILHSDNQTGWVARQLISSNYDLEFLPFVEPASATYGPMQAFYLQTGGNGGSPAACAEVPPDGLLVQTPAGAAKVRFWINEVRIDLGSTAFVQMTPDGQMVVRMLEGDSEVTALGISYRSPGGTQISIPMAGNQPSAPPTPPQPLQIDGLNALPLMVLGSAIRITEPTSVEAINGQGLNVPVRVITNDGLFADLGSGGSSGDDDDDGSDNSNGDRATSSSGSGSSNDSGDSGGGGDSDDDDGGDGDD